MAKYKMKPVIIEAWLWDETMETLLKIGGLGLFNWKGHQKSPDIITELSINGPVDDIKIKKGDYVCKLRHNNYICVPRDRFEEAYDMIEE